MKEHSSATHKDIPNKPGKTNWVEKSGGLPSFIERVAKHIAADSGYDTSRAIAAAVSQVKKMAAKGNAEAQKAVAQWEALKASHRGGKKTDLSVELSLWDASAHPRAKAGDDGGTGGQFVPLSYDSRKNTGTGYEKAEGDDRVKKLQKMLNRLGFKDANGKPLDVDGKMGPLTTSALAKYQKGGKGVGDEKTLSSLTKDYRKSRNSKRPDGKKKAK
jgi:hypothetical protein